MLSEEIKVAIVEELDFQIVTLVGVLDDENYASVANEFDQLIDDGYIELVLDLSGLKSVVQEAMIIFSKSARRLLPLNGIMALVGLQPEVRKYFENAGLLHMCPEYPSIQKALEKLAQ